MSNRPLNASHPAWALAGRVAPVVFLLLLLGVSRFALVRRFGLYEDDLTIIPGAVGVPLSELLGFIANFTVRLQGHGRPLSDSFIRLLSWIGWRAGGLDGMYLVGYAVLGLNAVLVFHLGRRLHSRSVGFLAGLFYCLYSADTTQTFLTHSLGLQPALTFVLLAFHAYLSRWKAPAYALSVLSLFTYESAYPVFLAAPLLVSDHRTPILRRSAWHILLMAALLAGAVWLRSSGGDNRIADLRPEDLLLVPLRHITIGPVVSLGSYPLRGVQTILSPAAEWALPALLVLPLLIWAIDRWTTTPGSERNRVPEIVAVQGPPGADPARPHVERLSLTQLVVAGLVMTGAAYLFTFGLRSFAISGRATRVHFAAALGVCLVWAGLCEAALRRPRRVRSIRIPVVLLGSLAALLVDYGFLIQDDYADAWHNQRVFWTDLAQEVPDVGDGTVILVDPVGLADTEQIDSNTWNLPRVLEQLFEFPDSWSEAPRVYRLLPRWRERIATGSCTLRLDNRTVTAPPSEYGEVSSRDVILLETEGGRLARAAEDLTLGDCDLKLRSRADPILGRLPTTLLHRLLIEGTRK